MRCCILTMCIITIFKNSFRKKKFIPMYMNVWLSEDSSLGNLWHNRGRYTQLIPKQKSRSNKFSILRYADIWSSRCYSIHYHNKFFTGCLKNRRLILFAVVSNYVQRWAQHLFIKGQKYSISSLIKVQGYLPILLFSLLL